MSIRAKIFRGLIQLDRVGIRAGIVVGDLRRASEFQNICGAIEMSMVALRGVKCIAEPHVAILQNF